MELLRQVRCSHCIAQSSFNGYCAIVAGSVIELHMHCEDMGMSAKANALLQEIISYLDIVDQYWSNADKVEFNHIIFYHCIIGVGTSVLNALSSHQHLFCVKRAMGRSVIDLYTAPLLLVAVCKWQLPTPFALWSS
jgi:hypothetical protein